jgi:nucleotide-binding universal stress UspA family protein/SAM-dependent methyltransferase
MEPALKKTLKSVTLALRHLLEGHFDTTGTWYPGDLEDRLASIGVRRDRAPRPLNELALTSEDQHARKVVDAYLKLREETGVNHNDAVVEFLRETAYTWANRLIALRCMESRELIDPVILQQDAYGGRSLEHHRLAQRQPELCAGEDDGLFAVLDKVFREQTQRLPMLFNPQAPGIALRPSPAAIKDCFGFLSLNVDTLQKNRIRIREDENALPDAEPPNPFVAPDALGWTYQYWNTEEKDRVFEKVRTVKGTKIAGADIVPATQLYTEDYMVKFLVQNSLGATWMAMHPDSTLSEHWEYYVRDADRAPVVTKPVRAITFLDPACGSGHFLIEAFDLYFAMYQAEGELTEPEDICTAILTQNLFGIDIDARAVQIAEAALWMKAAERSFDYSGAATNLVAATASHLKGPAWEEFLASFTKEPSIGRVLGKFAHTMEHIDEIGSLARPAEDLQAIIHKEHATWEQQVREQKEANFLFPEMRIEALSGQLEFNEISDEEFGDRLFYRARAGIDTFTEKARESGEFDDQMLASETRAGFRLVDLLSRKYDVVAANPPFMGSKNFAPALKQHVERHYKPGKRDLYAAFIIRDCELANPGGRVAMVTQQSWMFLRSFAELRAVDSDKLDLLNDDAFPGLLRGTTLETLAHLGPNAFGEIGGEVVNTALFTLSVASPSLEHRLTAFRLVGPKNPEEKNSLLIQALSTHVHTAKSQPIQHRFLRIPECPLCYWLRDRFFDALQSPLRLDSFAQVRQGLATTDNSRFTKCLWEVSSIGRTIEGHPVGRWFKYAKGGRYQKWSGLEWLVVDWRHDGAAIKQHVLRGPGTTHWSRRVANYEYYFRPGLTYTQMSRGSMGTRLLTDSIFDVKGMAIFLDDGVCSLDGLSAFLSTHVASYLLRVVTQNLEFHAGYVAGMPLPNDGLPELTECGDACRRLKDLLISSDLDEYAFHPSRVFNNDFMWPEQAALLSIEGYCEEQTCRAYDLANEDINAVMDETGIPAAWFPLVAGFDTATVISQQSIILPKKLAQWIGCQKRISLNQAKIADLRNSLRSAFEAGPGEQSDDEDSEQDEHDRDDEDEAIVGATTPIPTETFLEELSQKLRIHPISVLLLLKEGVENAGWRCIPEERRLCPDRITVTVLRLLGHRWPKEAEASEPVPDWAHPDGIIPLTPLVNESTLSERVRQRLSVDEIDISNFAEVMGKPLDAWLATEFFKHHTKQFKKRPIAWQVQSGSFTARNTPAIACLIYYHKLDSDLLRKVRKMAEDLRKSRETELRGIMSIAQEARSDRQVARRVELEDAVAELQRFDATLETVATTGFGPESLRPKLRQYALDDALLVMKARWLSRLSDLVFAGPLQDWLRAATQTEVHADFGSWITSAMSHLDHHCALVGPQAPDQSDLETDPTAVELAAIIAPQAASMQAKALSLGCDVWWKVLDDAVFAPLKEQIKRLKAEQKECEATLKSEPEPDDATTRKLKARVKELKAEVKSLDKDLKEQTVKAKNVREQIEAWKSDEPATWGDWLAEQPMFDQISSLDHRRPAPKTIAEFIAQESLYAPDINDGVRVNIAPLQKGGILAADVLAAKDLDKAIADRAEWRSDERRWVREGKLPQPGWWPEVATNAET